MPSMKMLAAALLLALGLALPVRAAEPAPLDQGTVDAIDALVRKTLQERKVPGLALAITRHGQLRYAKGYGKANLEHDVPVTPDTVFAIASVSKPLLALGVMRLVEQGKLSWSDPVAQHLPDAPASWSAITLAHLANHTAGLVRESPAFDGDQVQTDATLVAAAYPLPLAFPTGTRGEYCNVCYFALAEVMTRRSGMPWPQFMAQAVFEPAGMARTRTTTQSELVPGRADSYEWRDGRWLNQREYLALRPSGAFLSSVLDLARFEAALHDGRLVSEASWRQLSTPARLLDGRLAQVGSTPYGLGWRLDTLNGRQRVSHGGSLAGFRTHYARYPEPGWAVILLGNGAQLASGDLERAIAALLPR
jgi:D-alanyl-D-alanine carboxypeptidase